MITEKELEEFQKICEKSSPDPDSGEDGPVCQVCFNAVSVEFDESDFYEDPICDGCFNEFARAARTMVPRLIAEIKRLQEFEWKYKELCK